MWTKLGKKDLILLQSYINQFNEQKHITFVFHCGLLTTVLQKITCEPFTCISGLCK